MVWRREIIAAVGEPVGRKANWSENDKSGGGVRSAGYMKRRTTIRSTGGGQFQTHYNEKMRSVRLTTVSTDPFSYVSGCSLILIEGLFDNVLRGRAAR